MKKRVESEVCGAFSTVAPSLLQFIAVCMILLLPVASNEVAELVSQTVFTYLLMVIHNATDSYLFN